MVIALESYVFAVADVSGESNEHDYITVHATDLGEAQEKAEQMAKEEYPQWGKVSIECLESESFSADGYKGISAPKIEILEWYVKKGGKAGDFHDLPTDVQIRLQAGNVHELLYQDVNRWLQDNGYNPHMETPDWLSAESFSADLYKGQPCPHEWEEDKVKDWGDGIFTIYVSCKNCGTKSYIEGHADTQSESHPSPNSPYSEAESFSATTFTDECECGIPVDKTDGYPVCDECFLCQCGCDRICLRDFAYCVYCNTCDEKCNESKHGGCECECAMCGKHLPMEEGEEPVGNTGTNLSWCNLCGENLCVGCYGDKDNQYCEYHTGKERAREDGYGRYMDAESYKEEKIARLEKLQDEYYDICDWIEKRGVYQERDDAVGLMQSASGRTLNESQFRRKERLEKEIANLESEIWDAESFSAEEKQSEGFILGSVGVIGLFAIGLFAAMKFQNKKKTT